jgi:hypothetical protein
MRWRRWPRPTTCPEEAIADTLEALAGTRGHVPNLARYIRNLEAEVTAIEAARRSMERRQRSCSATRRGCGPISRPRWRRPHHEDHEPELVVRVQKNPPTVVVDEADEVPLAYKETRTETVLLKAATARP